MKRTIVSFSRLPRVVFMVGVAALLSSLAVPAHAQVTIDWVTVGNAGNANDPATGNVYGGVAYDYQIGKYDVTIGQYMSFGAPKPATHRRPKPATVWGVLNRRIVLFGPVGKGHDQVVAV